MGAEEGLGCSEALKGFARSPVPARGDSGCVEDEGVGALVVVFVRPPIDPQGLSLCQGLRAALCLGPCP